MPTLDSKVSNRARTSVNKSLRGSKALSFDTFDNAGGILGSMYLERERERESNLPNGNLLNKMDEWVAAIFVEPIIGFQRYTKCLQQHLQRQYVCARSRKLNAIM